MGGDPHTNDIIYDSKPFFISGMGANGEGAIVNNGPATQLFAFGVVTLTGNSAIGGTSRWDFRAGNPVLNLNGSTLDKVGTNQVSLVSAMLENTSATPAFVDVQGGLFSLEAATSTSGLGSITYENGVNAQFYNSYNSITWPMTFMGNNIIGNASLGLATVESPMVLNGAVTLEPLNGVSAPPINSNNPLALTGNISGTGALNVLGASTFTLSGSNSWSGGTDIQMGILQLGSNNALPSGTSLTVGDGGAAGTLDLGGFNATVGGLTQGASSTGVIGSSGNSHSTLTFAGGTNASTFSGTIQDAVNGGTGKVSLAVTSGSLTLTSGNTYSGGTTVNGGLLVAANSANSALGSGNVTMNGGILASARPAESSPATS